MNENTCIGCGDIENTMQEPNRLHVCKGCADKHAAEEQADFERELETEAEPGLFEGPGNNYCQKQTARCANPLQNVEGQETGILARSARTASRATRFRETKKELSKSGTTCQTGTTAQRAQQAQREIKVV